MQVEILDGPLSGYVLEDVFPSEYLDIFDGYDDELTTPIMKYHIMSDGEKWVGVLIKGEQL